jgi:hypothetical protein
MLEVRICQLLAECPKWKRKESCVDAKNESAPGKPAVSSLECSRNLTISIGVIMAGMQYKDDIQRKALDVRLGVGNRHSLISYISIS